MSITKMNCISYQKVVSAHQKVAGVSWTERHNEILLEFNTSFQCFLKNISQLFLLSCLHATIFPSGTHEPV